MKKITLFDLFKLSCKKGSINLSGGNPTSGDSTGCLCPWLRQILINSLNNDIFEDYGNATGNPRNKEMIAKYLTSPAEKGGMGLNTKQGGSDKIAFVAGVTQAWHLYAVMLAKEAEKRKNAGDRI